MKYVKLFEEFTANEAYIGPFVFNNSMSDEELKAMYNDALSGYANWQKGFKYPKSDYKKVYQEIEKILKKRGISIDESVVNEGKEVFPNQVEGNDQLIFKKTKEWMNGGKLSGKYNIYYRGYDIDAGGRVFGSVGELEKFIKDYILSNNLYNKYKHMPEKPIDETVQEKENLKRYGNELWNRGGTDDRKGLLNKTFGYELKTEDLVELPWSELPSDIRIKLVEIKA